MIFQSSFLILFSLLVVYSFPLYEKRDLQQTNKYIPPVYPRDVRSPCPGLNALANHGFINRTGGANLLDKIASAITAGLGPDGKVVVAAVLKPLAPFLVQTPQGLLMPSLTILTNSHGIGEHDSSLTRNDLYLDGSVKPGQVGPLVNTSLINQLLSFSTDGKYLTIEQLANASALRISQSMKSNGRFDLGPPMMGLLLGERALITIVIGRRSDNWRIRVDWLRSFLQYDRLPYELGWTPQTTNASDIQYFAGQYQALITKFLPYYIKGL